MSQNSLPSHKTNVDKIKLDANDSGVSSTTSPGSGGLPPKRNLGASQQRSSSTSTKPAGQKNIALILSLVMSTIFLAIGTYLAHMDLSLKGNSSTKSIGGMDAQSVGSQAGEPIDILLLGTDTRSGSVNATFGDAADAGDEGNSDSMMLLRVSGDRKRVSVVSFPRDLMVAGPECKNPNTGVVTPAQNPVMLNSILGYGGPECSVKAFTQLTGIQVDHYIEADFNSVIQLSNIVGGVDVCVNQAVDDPLSDLKLPKGKSQVQGEQALAFLRSRHGMGDGSDLGRIKSQQQFFSNLAKKLKSDGTLSNPIKVNELANAMLKYLNFDKGIASVPDLVGLADILKDIDLSNVTFVSVPTEPWTQDPNRLQLKQPQAKMLFDAINQDKDLADPYSYNGESRPPAPKPVDKGTVNLAIYNGSGATSRDQQVSQLAQSKGYTQTTANGDQAESTITTQIYYPPADADQAKQVAQDFGIQDAALVQSNDVSGVQIIVGTDWTSGDTVPKQEKVIPGGLSGQTANDDTCQVAANE